MSSKKEEKSQAAAEKIKAAALTAAKGLSRSQAERAATAAARNVNAYGQKEEGPSRWQERKEAKRQMYLMSTEKAVKLGERKNVKATSSGMGGGVASQCQKCFQTGHWTYECKNERVYISRPSRSQQLKNPKLRQKLMESYSADNPDIQEEENGGKKDEKSGKNKSKRKHTDSGSDSEASVFDSDSRSSSASGSDSSSAESASSDSSSSDSEEDRRRRKKRKQKKTGRRKSKSKRYSSSSDDSEDESSSDSDSDDRRSSRKKSRKHSRRQ